MAGCHRARLNLLVHHQRGRYFTLERLDPEARGRGLTLPQAVLLLQPVLRCWAGRCRTCRQPVDLEQLTLLRQRE